MRRSPISRRLLGGLLGLVVCLAACAADGSAPDGDPGEASDVEVDADDDTDGPDGLHEDDAVDPDADRDTDAAGADEEPAEPSDDAADGQHDDPAAEGDQDADGADGDVTDEGDTSADGHGPDDGTDDDAATDGDGTDDDVATDDADTFVFEAQPVPDAVRDEMVGVSWEEGCPVGLDDLRLVELTHPGFDGEVHAGELVVHRDVVADLEQVFATIWEEWFPLERVERIEVYDGDDDASMAANNTVAFTCRAITGGESFSEHSYGTAIDFNPRQNPYRRDGTVLPPDGEPYLDRDDVREGMIVEGDAIVTAFDELGWEWGGRWNTLDDWMHFERPR